MDPTSLFFRKLRKVAVTLEIETTKLQQTFENRHNIDDDCQSTARAMRVFHEMNSDAGTLKKQVQDQMVQQKTEEAEVRGFINASQVMEQRLIHDIQTFRGHWEKYGYKTPRNTENQADTKCMEGMDETNTAEEEKGENPDDDKNQISTPSKAQPPINNGMRTPQLSDFGLSELQMKKAFAGMDWCVEAPSMPELSLHQPSLQTPALPKILTPKCALRMDDEELQTPRMHDFGISEHTMCLNNDFTMNLIQKNTRLSEDIPEPQLINNFQTKANELESPDPPVFCTPGLKIKKPKGQCPSPEQTCNGVQSPFSQDKLPSTPEVPAFQTPHMKHLATKEKSTLPPAAEAEKIAYDSHGSTPTWKCEVVDNFVDEAGAGQIPAMPVLESALGSSLLSRTTKARSINGLEKSIHAPPCSLELDGPTKEFDLRTPRIRNTSWEPNTPEMPDLSSVTMDICKLVSQANKKKTLSTPATLKQNTNTGNPKHSKPHLHNVSESEFQSLPNHLRQMTLRNLNEAIHSINKFTESYHGQILELQMEDLKTIIKVGAKAPIYILCLAELKRLQCVEGVTNMSVLKLITHH